MAEGVERFVGDVAIARLEGGDAIDLRTPGGAVVVIIGLLSRRLREADGEPALRREIAEQDVGQRVAGLRAQEPGAEHGLRVAQGARERQRPAMLEDDHHRLAGAGDGFGEVLLAVSG